MLRLDKFWKQYICTLWFLMTVHKGTTCTTTTYSESKYLVYENLLI